MVRGVGEMVESGRGGGEGGEGEECWWRGNKSGTRERTEERMRGGIGGREESGRSQ